MKFTPAEFLAKLPLPAAEKWTEGVWFTEVFPKGDFELEFFAPRGTDYQMPHARDVFYIIVGGAADLIKEDETINCTTGDAVFIAAGVKHHFENIADDFAAWMIFF